MSKSQIYILVAALLIAGTFIGRYLYFQPKFINGVTAPNFTATAPAIGNFELQDLQGKYVLLDFWGSWCAPCLREAPALRKLNEEYKNAAFTDAGGFEIVSIGIEEDASRWEQAIKRLQLDWRYHVLDETTSFKFFDAPLATQYGVKEVPTKYLIDPKGVIVGVNQSFEEINQFLKNRKR